jgi:hypothetical protein
VSDRPKIKKPRAWVKVLLVFAVGLAAIALVGRLSVLLSLPNTNTDTKQYLEDRSRESGKQQSATDSCWIEPPGLAARGLPEYFAQGPGRYESSLDTVFFKPRFVLRPASEDPCPRGGEKDGSWGYVRSKSTLPFFIRTHFGYFSDAETSNDSIEGVRTYFSLFGKELLLNEWSVEHEGE